MAIIGDFTQQPADRLDYDIPYDVAADDALQSVSISNVVPSGLTVSGLVIPGNRVKLWVEGGAAGTKYKIEVLVTTVLGRIKEDEVVFRIKDF